MGKSIMYYVIILGMFVSSVIFAIGDKPPFSLIAANNLSLQKFESSESLDSTYDHGTSSPRKKTPKKHLRSLDGTSNLASSFGHDDFRSSGSFVFVENNTGILPITYSQVELNTLSSYCRLSFPHGTKTPADHGTKTPKSKDCLMFNPSDHGTKTPADHGTKTPKSKDCLMFNSSYSGTKTPSDHGTKTPKK